MQKIKKLAGLLEDSLLLRRDQKEYLVSNLIQMTSSEKKRLRKILLLERSELKKILKKAYEKDPSLAFLKKVFEFIQQQKKPAEILGKAEQILKKIPKL